ncbi:MAG: cytochrome P450 [Gammaproteobacteria bacterium]|nr:cytochrome P450 [Gammaproteobacteria bacterium]
MNFLTMRNAEVDIFDAMQSCVQTDWVFKETLRLYSPLSSLPRRTLETVEIQGFTILPNTSITLVPRFVHHISSIYSETHRFDPERFSPTRSEDQVHRCAWVPFGKGAHACIGMHFARMEVFVFFSRLLERYRIQKTDGSLRLDYVPVLKPRKSIPIRLVAH